jgi:hypothetical protein
MSPPCTASDNSTVRSFQASSRELMTRRREGGRVGSISEILCPQAVRCRKPSSRRSQEYYAFCFTFVAKMVRSCPADRWNGAGQNTDIKATHQATPTQRVWVRAPMERSKLRIALVSLGPKVRKSRREYFHKYPRVLSDTFDPHPTLASHSLTSSYSFTLAKRLSFTLPILYFNL